jgi:hypothetical protein
MRFAMTPLVRPLLAAVLVAAGASALCCSGEPRAAAPPGSDSGLPPPPAHPPPLPAGLLFESPGLDLGPIAPGEEREVEAAWRRTGAGPLRVLGVRTGCGCLSASGLDGTLAPGERGTLRLRIRARERIGPFSLEVRVHLDRGAESDGAREAVLDLPLRGTVTRAPGGRGDEAGPGEGGG